jgi:hypothetical protein
MRYGYLILLLAVRLTAADLLSTQSGVSIPAGDWVDVTSSLNGLVGTTKPYYVTGWDKYSYVPALHAYCGVGSYFQPSSEPNQNWSCYSFEENRWYMVSMAGSWHNEHLQEGGHPMGNVLVDPTTSTALGFQGSSGSQVSNVTKWGMWRFDFLGQVGIPQQPMMAAAVANQLETAAYDAARQIMIGFGGSSGGQGHIQYDNNASHSSVVNTGYNAYNTWSLSMGVTLNGGLSANIDEHAMAYNLSDGRTYLFGGLYSGTTHNGVWAYTPGASGAPGTWNPVWTDGTSTSASCTDALGGNNCPAARQLASFAYDAEDNIFLMAGGTLNGTAPQTGILNDAWIFDPVAVTWKQVATIDYTRHVFAFNETTATLVGAIGSSDTSLTVSSLTNGFNAAAVVIQIDGEFIYCTTRVSTTFSACTRGFENTTPASHANGATAYAGTEPSGPNERLAWMPEDNVFLLFLQPSGSSNNAHMVALRLFPGGHAGYLSRPYSYTAVPVTGSTTVGPLNRNTADATHQSWIYGSSVASDGTNLYIAGTETATFQSGGNPANSWLPRPYVQKVNPSSTCGNLSTNTSCLGSSYSSLSPDVGGNPRNAFDISCAVIAGAPWCYWHETDAALTDYAYAKGWDGSGWNLGGLAPKIATTAYDGPGQIIGVGSTPTIVHLEQDRTTGSGSPFPVYAYVRQWNGSSWTTVGGSALNSGFTVADSPSIATDGTNIWISFTLYSPLAVTGTNKNGEWFGPPQVQLWNWNGTSWTQQGASGNVLGSGCTGAISNGTPLPTYTGTSCSRAYNTSLTVLGGVPYVAFVERTDQGILQKLWIRKFSAGSWSTVGSTYLNRDCLNGWAFRPELTNDGTNLYVTWAEQGNPESWIGTFAYPANSPTAQKPKVYAASVTTGGTVSYLGGALNADTTSGSATHPSIAMYQSRPVVSWGEVNIGSDRQLYAKQWNGTDWTAAALPGSSCSIAPTAFGPFTSGEVVSVTLTANNCGGGTLTWTASGLPGGVSGCNSVNGMTCVLSGTLTTGATYTASISVSDGGNNSAVVNPSIIVNAAPSVTTNSLPAGTQGSPYGAQVIAVSGGTAPLTCAANSGVPAGMTVHSGCTIDGTPSVAGSFTVNVTATDANTISSASHSITLTITSNLTSTGVTELSGTTRIVGGTILH